MAKPVRQGDVYLMPIDASEIPAGAKCVTGKVILAVGEKSGHNHQFAEGANVKGFFKEGADDHFLGGGATLVGGATEVNFIVVSGDGADLVHTSEPVDHATIPVDPGAYRVLRQREYVGPDLTQRVVD